MALDPRIIEAIYESVDEFGQSKELATKLIAWLEALTSGNENIEDKDSVERHVELLYKVMKFQESPNKLD